MRYNSVTETMLRAMEAVGCLTVVNKSEGRGLQRRGKKKKKNKKCRSYREWGKRR